MEIYSAKNRLECDVDIIGNTDIHVWQHLVGRNQEQELILTAETARLLITQLEIAIRTTETGILNGNWPESESEESR